MQEARRKKVGGRRKKKEQKTKNKEDRGRKKRRKTKKIRGKKIFEGFYEHLVLYQDGALPSDLRPLPFTCSILTAYERFYGEAGRTSDHSIRKEDSRGIP